MLPYSCIHRSTPLLLILRSLPAHDIEVQILQLLGDWSNLPGSNRAMINTHNWRNLDTCSAEEDLISNIELCAVYFAFAGDAIELAACQLHDGVAGDTEQNVFSGGRSD